MIYQNIKEIAKKKGIPLCEIERQAGLSAGAITKWKVVSPNVKSLQAVAMVLKVSITKLVG